MSGTREWLERYERNIKIREIGEEGQEKLSRSSVLVIGAGGLGSPAAFYLAAAGVGRIGLADADVVSLSNLQRQILHRTEDLGRKKVESGRDTLLRLNPELKVDTYPVFLTNDNIREVIRPYDFILECTDNFESKFLVNDACVEEGKPFCHASIVQFSGELMTVVPGQGPCYRCVFHRPPREGAVPTAREVGIIGALGGIFGSLQALEAVRYLTGIGELAVGRILYFDGMDLEWQTVETARDPACSACGGGQS